MTNEISDAQKHHFCQELIDLIVDHIPLGHRKTLCRIALTSKSFCISAQRRLFHTITFKEESMPVGEEGLGEYFDYIDHEGSEDIANYFDVSRKFISTRLSRVLSNTPHLAGLVKVVRIYDHTCLKDPSAVDWLMDFEDVDSDYTDFEESDNEEDMLGPWLPHDTSLNHILPLLTNLESVYLGGFFVDGSPNSSGRLDIRRMSALYAAMQYPKICKLVFRHIRTELCDLVTLISQSPSSLKHLELRDVSVDSTSALNDLPKLQPDIVPAQLESLVFFVVPSKSAGSSLLIFPAFDWRSLRTLKLVWGGSTDIDDIIKITHSAPVLEHLCVLATLGNPSQSVVGRGPNELFKLSNVKVLHFNVNISEVGPAKLLDWWHCSLESSMPCLRLHTIKLDVCPETTGLTRIFNHSACQLDSLLAQQITPPKLQLFVNMMAPVPGLDTRHGSVSIPKGMLTALKEAFPLMASKGCIYRVQKYKNRKHRLGCSESLENHMGVKTLGYTV